MGAAAKRPRGGDRTLRQMKPDDAAQRAILAKTSVLRWGWYSIAVNIVLAALHGVIAVASGSLAVTAELTHNLVDLISAGAVLVLRSLQGGEPDCRRDRASGLSDGL